jgi:hypothetical protein
MVVMFLGCLGVTAGLAVGTLFSSNEVRPSIPSFLLPAHGSCHHERLQSPHLKMMTGVASKPAYLSTGPQVGRCLTQLPIRISDSAPSNRLSMGGYVLFGLLAGLSAALGFLVPPRPRLTAEALAATNSAGRTPLDRARRSSGQGRQLP